ncbi:MAG: restriction endonuclease subunit S [Lewinellaceae bacterium]|nr:restriction endonuclease subunit S [Lewinellaceae bacterium]
MVERFQQTEVGLIPIDWEIKSLHEIADINPNNGKGLPDEFVYIDLESVTQGQLVKINIVRKENAPSRAQRVVLSGDILFQTVRPYQKNNLYFLRKGNYIASTGYAVIRARVDSGFLYAQLHTDKFVKTVIDLCTGTSYPAINPNVLSTIKIPLPTTLAEQAAIATALNDADALIAQLEKLITKKRAIKQGAMQELLRPKEGWEVKKLGKICNKITTGKLDANAMKPDGEYRFYTCAKDFYLIDKYAFDDEALLISGNGENVGYVHYFKGKFNAYQRTYVLTGFSINIQFIKIYLDKYLAARIEVEVNAGNTPYIRMGTLTEMEIYFPKSEIEQTHIAQILSDMDSEIQELENQLKKYKMLKHGMMQQLLTGKIRLI